VPIDVRLALQARPCPKARQNTQLRLSAFRLRIFLFRYFPFVIAGHSRSQNGVAKLAYARQSMQ
jgi:hypothetical protein